MGNSSSTQINALKTTYEANHSALKAQLELFLKKTEALEMYLSKADYQSRVSALATKDDLTTFVKATDLDNKLASYLRSDNLKSADIDKMVASLVSNNAFINELSSTMAQSSAAIAQAVAPIVARDTEFSNTITTGLKSDQNFLGFLADKLTTDLVYKQRITGPIGAAASPASIETAVKPNTMWCTAGGDVCSVPTGKKGNFPSDVVVAGKLSAASAQVDGNINMKQGKDLDFAIDAPARAPYAGTIAYNKHQGNNERPQLEILGGGKTGQSLKVRVYNELEADKVVSNNYTMGNGFYDTTNTNHRYQYKDGDWINAFGAPNNHFRPLSVFDSQIQMLQGQPIDFARNATKDPAAGTIQYNRFEGNDERPRLEIVGGGKAGQQRNVTIWDDLEVKKNLSIETLGRDYVFSGFGAQRDQADRCDYPMEGSHKELYDRKHGACTQMCPPGSYMVGIANGNEFYHKHPICKYLR